MPKAKAKEKSNMSDAGMRHVVNVLVCRHKWSEPRIQSVEMQSSGKKPRRVMNASVMDCERSGTVRIDHDGISSLYPRQ